MCCLALKMQEGRHFLGVDTSHEKMYTFGCGHRPTFELTSDAQTLTLNIYKTQSCEWKIYRF